jgi:hypothetical protein
VGGVFTNLCGQGRPGIGRFNATDPASQTLSYDGATVIWLRGGTGPEVWRTTFEVSIDGTNWTSLGAGTRIAGGWQLTGVSAPCSSTIRARGFVTGGYDNASSWFLESRIQAGATRPTILVNDGRFGFGSYGFGFNFTGASGLTAVVQGSTNLLNWLDLWTNRLSTGTVYFSDPQCMNFPVRFYRVRTQ